MKWAFRKINLNDSNRLFSWRNNPEIYRYFFSPKPVTLEDHKLWMERVVVNPRILFFIGEYNHQDAGTIRLDFCDDFSEAEVGIYLDPEFHGLGLGGEMLIEAEKVIKKEYPTLKKIIAKVMIENISSEKMFEKVGYRKQFIQLEKKIED